MTGFGNEDFEATDRRLAAAAAGEPEVRAPEGFAERVMAVVYREALAGGPARSLPVVSARTYRRLGLSFVLSAAVVAAALVVPAGLTSVDLRPGATGVVRNAMVGADALVRGALGSAATPLEGGSRR